MPRIVTVLVLLSFWIPQVKAQSKPCINWPKVFAQETVRRLPPSNLFLSVSPIYDDTSVEGDEWLSQGLSFLLSRYLSVDSGLNVLPESHVNFLPPSLPVRFKIGGLFQHTKNWLRIFIQLKDSKGKLLAQFPVETPYPLHQQFFAGLRETTQRIFEKIGHKKGIDTNALKAIEKETGNVRAFENFIKGKQALESYDPNKVEVALIWFQEARREDGQYAGAYRGLAEAYGFLSLVHKQNDEPYTAHLEALENTWREMSKRVRTKETAKAQNRFLQAHVHYVTGSRALTKGDALKAAAELEEAARLVPEDAQTAYNLSQAYDKMGTNELAGKNRNHAEEINPCLKK